MPQTQSMPPTLALPGAPRHGTGALRDRSHRRGVSLTLPRPVVPGKTPHTRPMLVSAHESEGTGAGITLEGVYLLDPDTGSLIPVAVDAENSMVAPAWSPDGRRVMLMRGTATGYDWIHVVDEASDEVASVSGAGFPLDWYDDDTILFLRGLRVCADREISSDEDREAGELFAVHLPTATTTQVTRFAPNVEFSSVHWHPRGGLALDIKPARSDWSVIPRLAVVPAATVRAAVGGGRPVTSKDLTSVEPFGKNWGGAQPSWSPDGKRLVFMKVPPGQPGTGSDIAVLDVRTGQAQVLLQHGAVLPEPPLPPGQMSYDGSPVFSPDGRQIAWVRGYLFDWHEVWVMQVDGSQPRQVTHLDRVWMVVYLDW
jgi:Tol biopolymer transport system component